MLTLLVSMIRIVIILPFIVLAASAIAVIALLFLVGLPALFLLPMPVAAAIQTWPIAFIIIPVLFVFCGYLIALLLALAPIILLLAIFDAFANYAHRRQAGDPIILTDIQDRPPLRRKIPPTI